MDTASLKRPEYLKQNDLSPKIHGNIIRKKYGSVLHLRDTALDSA